VTKSRPSIGWREVLSGWGKVLAGKAPMLSIEITRECPLSCPGCYAYGDAHLGGETVLRDLRDFRGEQLVTGVLDLVRKHRPLHVSLVGGEPMVRHRELSSILPALSSMNIFTLVVTSGVIPIPTQWMAIPRLRVAVSVDGLPEHHDVRRKPATYERILKNIEGREINVHWVITRPMLQRADYLAEYVAFWNAQPEVKNMWVSLYTPQVGEQSAEMLTAEDRRFVARELPRLRHKFPKLQVGELYAEAFVAPPVSPADCIFAKMSVNYSADLKTRVEPCVFGGTPDCSQCGCSASSAMHSIRNVKIAGPLRVGHLVGASMNLGMLMNRLRGQNLDPARWDSREASTLTSAAGRTQELVQIERR
jgi:MoaA/NifB/PqqE/SkfB family radical SAM enzyme